MALPTTDEVCELLRDTSMGMGEGTADPVDDPPEEVRPLLDKLRKPSTRRSGMLTLLGYVAADGDPIDFRAVGEFPGGRAVGQCVADDLLPGLGIPEGKDVHKTGVTATCDRARPAELARWRSGAGRCGRLSFVHGSNRGGHGGRRTTARGGTRRCNTC